MIHSTNPIIKHKTGLLNFESPWSAIHSVASKIGCTPETLRTWVKKEVDEGPKPGMTSE